MKDLQYFLKESEKYYKGIDKEDKKTRKSQFKKQTNKADSDKSAYKDVEGDEEARNQGKVKTSKHTKKYNKLYKKESINESEGLNGSKIDDPSIEKALKKKSDETGVSLEIIRTIMKRGMAAWKTGHRPGATQQQWGYARCNSFLTKGSGTWGAADKDMAKLVKDRGQDSKLKS